MKCGLIFRRVLDMEMNNEENIASLAATKEPPKDESSDAMRNPRYKRRRSDLGKDIALFQRVRIRDIKLPQLMMPRRGTP